MTSTFSHAMGNRIGQLICEHRRRAGLSQRELAGQAGVSLGALRDLEQGRTLWPRWGSVESIAIALGLDSSQHDELVIAWSAGTQRRPLAAATGSRVSRRMPGGVQLGILGPFTTTLGGQPVDLGPVRQRTVLALLALSGDRSVRLAELIDLFWPDQPPATASTIVHGYISRLRRLLKPARAADGHRHLLTCHRQAYRLEAGACCQLDSASFQQLVRSGQAAGVGGNPARATEMYDRALALWRGTALEDIELLHEHPLVTRLNNQRSDTVIRFADTAFLIGGHGLVVPHLRDLCARDVLNEQAVARLLLALAATGQRATAIAAFRQFQVRLHQELRIEPGRDVIRAYSQIAAAN